jgi:hypothetical protein
MIYYRIAVCRSNKLLAEISGADVDAVLDNVKWWLTKGLITKESPLELTIISEDITPTVCGDSHTGQLTAPMAQEVENGRQ